MLFPEEHGYKMNLKSQLNGLLKLFECGLRCSSLSMDSGCGSAVFPRSSRLLTGARVPVRVPETVGSRV